MGKHHAPNTESEVLEDFLPTMVITDYVSAMTVYAALTNAANDWSRMARSAVEGGNINGATRYVDNATRCRNLADRAYQEACTIAAATAEENGYTDVV